MEIPAHLEAIEREGSQLAADAASAPLTSLVPGCPDWTLRDLLAHVGEVHRWAAAVITHAVPKPSALPEGAIDATPPADALLVDWYATGHVALLETLRNAPADLECFSFLPAPSPLAFWARRQAHETAIHRADASGAAGRPISYDDDLANDGIQEILFGFGARPRVFEPGSVRLAPEGSKGWHLTLGAEGLAVVPDGGQPADATVAGTPTDIYLWLWNRPSAAVVSGDGAVADRWKDVQVRWS